MKITKRSFWTGLEHTLDLPISDDQIQQLLDGGHIDTVLSNLTAAEREFVISGITEDEYKVEVDAGVMSYGQEADPEDR